MNQIDFHRDSQSPFIIFSGQKDHEDEAIRKAQEFIEKNVHSKIMVDELAIRRRHLKRSPREEPEPLYRPNADRNRQ